MKHTYTLFLLLSISFFIDVNCARKQGAEEYWKKVMKDEPIPAAIEGLLVEEDATTSASPSSVGSSSKRKTHFAKNFDTRSIAVIYAKPDEFKKKSSNKFNEHQTKEEEDKSFSKTARKVPTHNKQS